jgi:hypothetical protein
VKKGNSSDNGIDGKHREWNFRRQEHPLCAWGRGHALTPHSVTRNEQVNARVAWMESILHTPGEFSIRQSNCDNKPVWVAGGALMLKDELQCQFEIVARRQE